MFVFTVLSDILYVNELVFIVHYSDVEKFYENILKIF